MIIVVSYNRMDIFSEALDTVIKPGMKIQLFGPLHIKKGKIYLRNNNIRVLGGFVDELVERFSTENVLSQKVGKRVDGPAFPFLKGAPKRPQLDLTKLSTQRSTQSQRPTQSSTQRPAQSSTQRPSQSSTQRPVQSQAGLRQIAPSQIQVFLKSFNKNLYKSYQDITYIPTLFSSPYTGC